MLTDKKRISKGVTAYDSIDITCSKWRYDSGGEWVGGWEAEDWGGCDCEGAAQAFFLIVKEEFCILIIMWLHKLICVTMFNRTKQ